MYFLFSTVASPYIIEVPMYQATFSNVLDMESLHNFNIRKCYRSPELDSISSNGLQYCIVKPNELRFWKQ